MKIDDSLTPARLLPAIERMWALSANKISALDASFDFSRGAPVHTVAGRYQPKGWTDWTQGFAYGSALLQFDATGERQFLDKALTRIRDDMPQHITHFGVHDHGFNQVSTYGNLLRLVAEDKLPAEPSRAAWIITAWPSAVRARCRPIAGPRSAPGKGLSTSLTARTPCLSTRCVPCGYCCWRTIWGRS